MIRLADPWILLMCLLVPVAVYLARMIGKKKRSSIRFSEYRFVKGVKPSFRISLSKKMIYLRGLSLIFLILAASRPQATIEKTRVFTEGIDIVLAVDASGSMRAMDFEIKRRRVDRLEVVKDVVSSFIEKRPNDRIGIVAFSGLAYTICPLTLDHNWLEKNLERIQIGMIEDGTAIGSALSASLNRVKDTETKEKVIILLTDGRNNAGRISPMIAAEAAATLGVKVYTIGAGTKGYAPYPVKDMFGNTVLKPVEIEIDEDLLKKIAQITNGEYFRATDTKSLERIYDKIDELEKTPMEETGFNIYRELFYFPLLLGLILLLIELILSNTYLRRMP